MFFTIFPKKKNSSRTSLYGLKSTVTLLMKYFLHGMQKDPARALISLKSAYSLILGLRGFLMRTGQKIINTYIILSSSNKPECFCTPKKQRDLRYESLHKKKLLLINFMHFTLRL